MKVAARSCRPGGPPVVRGGRQLSGCVGSHQPGTELKGPVGIVKETSNAGRGSALEFWYFLGVLASYFALCLTGAHVFDGATGYLFRLSHRAPAAGSQLPGASAELIARHNDSPLNQRPSDAFLLAMAQAWYLVCSAMALPVGMVSGCDSDDQARKAMDPGDGGSASGGGDGGDAGSPSAAGTPDPGAAGQGGVATEPGSGGQGGSSDVNGGAPTGAGGDGSPGGADGSAAGAGNGGAFVRSCSYPNGGACDEIAGTFEQASMFELACLNAERIADDACPSAGVAGTCTFTQEGATLKTVHYNPIEAQELASAQQSCGEIPGTWTTP